MKFLLIVSGSISAYKTADVISSLLKNKENEVEVIMTKAATDFITPLTLSSLSHKKVLLDEEWMKDGERIFHIDAVEKADAVVLCPATANIIAKFANGIADNLATASLLAALGMKKKIFIFPAMNTNMLEAETTVENFAKLANFKNIKICETDSGTLACGAIGKGKLLKVEEIIKIISK